MSLNTPIAFSNGMQCDITSQHLSLTKGSIKPNFCYCNDCKIESDPIKIKIALTELCVLEKVLQADFI